MWVCVYLTVLFYKIVYGESALIGDAREIRDGIYADHIGMAKFSTRNDSGYKKVLNAIETLLEGPVERELVPVKPSTYKLCVILICLISQPSFKGGTRDIVPKEVGHPIWHIALFLSSIFFPFHLDQDFL
jgi:hypothetical protein